MAISTALVVGLLAFGPGHPLGDMPAYLDAMETAAAIEDAEAQVVDVLSRHARSFLLATSDRTEFVQLVRSNRKWLVVPPERERTEF